MQAFTKIALLLFLNFGCSLGHTSPQLVLQSAPTADKVSAEVRNHWMRRAIQALADLRSPCPFNAFGAVIVNHTGSSELGEEICIGANAVAETGNPTLHGEIAAIANCTDVLGDPKGRFRLSDEGSMQALKDLSLYTTAEACSMCASAIRWSGFREYIYGSSIDRCEELGWNMIDIPSAFVMQQSQRLGPPTRLVAEVLTNETDVLFGWQYRHDGPCPAGCSRNASHLCDAS